jgi:hypothetical protein
MEWPAPLLHDVRVGECFEALVSGQVSSVAELATVEGVSDRYVSSLLPLALLAPDIVEAIASGRQPPALTAHRLISPGVPVFSRRVSKTRTFPALLVHESEPETVAGDAVPARTGVRSPFKKRRFGFGVCGFA